MKITLLGSPFSTNSVYATMCRGNFPKRYLTNKGRALKESYQWQAKSQWHVDKALTGPLEIAVKLYFDNKRAHDIDNYHKLSLDALTGIVYEDDNQIQKMTVEKFFDKMNPRIEIDIYDLASN